jgi:hypothetical protein
MIPLDAIYEMWKVDSPIDEMNLDAASIQGAKLHSKYIEIWSMYRLTLKKREAELQVLLKNKYLWYNGKMSKSEMDNLGWEYDALDGLKIMKGEMHYFYDSDKDIQQAVAKIEYTKNVVDVLKEIMESIKWRHQTIGNAIKWRQFTSGM